MRALEPWFRDAQSETMMLEVGEIEIFYAFYENYVPEMFVRIMKDDEEWKKKTIRNGRNK